MNGRNEYIKKYALKRKWPHKRSTAGGMNAIIFGAHFVMYQSAVLQSLPNQEYCWSHHTASYANPHPTRILGLRLCILGYLVIFAYSHCGLQVCLIAGSCFPGLHSKTRPARCKQKQILVLSRKKTKMVLATWLWSRYQLHKWGCRLQLFRELLWGPVWILLLPFEE